MQTTIQYPVSCYGLGVHSGKRTHLTLKPGQDSTGVVFVRTDVAAVDNVIYANYDNVSETTLSTTVSNNAGIKVSTVEHLMAAIWGCGIDNVVAEIDGEEVPIMDGSSEPFVFMLECAGTKLLNAPRPYIKILKEFTLNNGDMEINVTPSDEFMVDMTIDFPNKVIGRQNKVFNDHGSFKDELARARTFGFLHELEYLRNKGLAKGASLENAIGFDQNGIMNSEGLRFEDECVRHKLLDAVGDFFTAGRLIGKFKCHKTGHNLNNQLLRKLLENPNLYTTVTC